MHHHKKGHSLTKEQIKAMHAVADGADVYNRTIATRLREVERNRPELIKITKPERAPRNGAAAQPYFGAILTAAGIVAITPRKQLRASAARIAAAVAVQA